MDSTPVKIAEGLNFAEGPLWHPDSYLLVSDTGANCIRKINMDGTSSIFLENSGCAQPAPHANVEKLGSNGMKWDMTTNRLVMCRQGEHCIARFDGKNFETLTASFEGRPFNSPNDLVVSRDGTIYFSDPPYGIEGELLLPAFRQPCAGLYAWHEGKTKLLFDGLNFPNGVCLSPDEAVLYVSSNHPDEPYIYKAILTDTNLRFEIFTSNNADGILSDDEGNIYTANGDYIHKFNAQGVNIFSYFIGEATSNLTWGGPHKKDLFVTCYHSVWHIPNVLP